MASAQTRPPSGAAIGWTYFAAMMMILIGVFHAIAGLIAIVDDEFYVGTRNYVLQFDTTQWGWIHLIVGIVVAVSGGYLLTGIGLCPHDRRDHGVRQCARPDSCGSRTAPVWGVIFIAIAVSVIWALTVHGRDVTYDA